MTEKNFQMYESILVYNLKDYSNLIITNSVSVRKLHIRGDLFPVSLCPLYYLSQQGGSVILGMEKGKFMVHFRNDVRVFWVTECKTGKGSVSGDRLVDLKEMRLV